MIPAFLCVSPLGHTMEQAPASAITMPEKTPLTAAQALIQRVLPQHATSFICELIPDEGGMDAFEVDVRNNKIVLRGNNGISLAMAFNWYLRYNAMIGRPLSPWKSRVLCLCLTKKHATSAKPKSVFS